MGVTSDLNASPPSRQPPAASLTKINQNTKSTRVNGFKNAAIAKFLHAPLDFVDSLTSSVRPFRRTRMRDTPEKNYGWTYLNREVLKTSPNKEVWN